MEDRKAILEKRIEIYDNLCRGIFYEQDKINRIERHLKAQKRILAKLKRESWGVISENKKYDYLLYKTNFHIHF
jgi:hypothetical protein